VGLVLVAGLLWPATAAAEPMVAVTFAAPQKLLSFDSATPGTVSSVTISGLMAADRLGGIDTRPGTGQLYALGSSGRLYILDPATGAATMGPMTAFSTPGGGSNFAASPLGFGFDPLSGKIRVNQYSIAIAAEDDRNASIDADTGAVVAGGFLAVANGDPSFGVDPAVSSVAFRTDPAAGDQCATLYGIDSITGQSLVTQGSPGGSPESPDTGLLHTVGPLGVNPSAPDGFDISPGGVAYYGEGGPPNLHTVNLTTGAMTLVGTITVAPGDFLHAMAAAAPAPQCGAAPGGGGAGDAADTDPPETTIAKGPKRKTGKRKAKFEFTADEPGGFECRLDDGDFAPCGSEAQFKVKRGKHTLEVRALDTAGNVDPTPASHRWKVRG
jgi:hypothetical protein